MDPHSGAPAPLYPKINTGPDEGYLLKNPNFRKVYFFERENGDVFFTDAKDAWSILKGRKQVLGRQRERTKLIGVTEGKIYAKAVQESHQIFKEKGLEAAQERLRQGIKEELEACRGKVEMPPDPDMTDLHGNPFDFNTVRK